MTLYGFYEHYSVPTCDIKVLSAYNGKLLCKRYNPQKHGHLNSREVSSIWADVQVVKGTFCSIAKPILCLYVDGREEYEEEQRKKKQQNSV